MVISQGDVWWADLPEPTGSRPVVVVQADALNRSRIAAIDGGGARLYLFDAGKGKLLKSRPLALTPGGRWHLAGVHPLSRALYLVTETLDRVCAEVGEEVDDFSAVAARRLLERSEW